MKIPTIRFTFARKGLQKKNGKGAIEMVITYDRQRKYISTGISVYPGNWDDAKMVVGSGEDMELNDILLTMRKKALKEISEMVENGEIDLSTLSERLKAKKVDMTFLEYVYERMSKKNVVDYTHKSYVSFYNKLSEYGGIVTFSDITDKAIRDFDEWLHAYKWTEKDRYGNDVTKSYTQATIGSFHKNMKNFIADAVVDGYLHENVYKAKNIKIDKGKSRIDKFLTLDEIKRLEAAKMPTRGLQEAKDLFMMQVYTGLAYVDLMGFDFKRFSEESGEIVYTGIRHKTGVEFVFVLLPEARAILHKYRWQLPKMPNQKYNMRLKMVADAAGIDKPITSHDGRRSCGYMLLNAGVPMEIVSRVLGHESVKMTESAYAKVLNQTVVAAIAKMGKATKGGKK